MEHRPRRKQLNSDTNASNKTYLKEIQEKRKEETFFFRKMKKENEKHQKNQKMKKNEQKMRKNEKKKRQKKREKGGKKGKEGPKGYHPRWAQKLIFHIRIVKRNRNEIDAQKRSDFEHPTKKEKMKENEKQRK